MNYLRLCLSLFGIFASKALNRSPLRLFGLETKSTQKIAKAQFKANF